MKRRIRWSASAAVAAAVLAGCAGARPAWVGTASGVGVERDGRRYLYGVGSAQGAGDVRMLEKLATADARANLGASLREHAKELVESERRVERGPLGRGTVSGSDKVVTTGLTDTDLPPHVCDQAWPADPAEQAKRDLVYVRCRIEPGELEQFLAGLQERPAAAAAKPAE